MNPSKSCCVQCQRILQLANHGLCSLCNGQIQRGYYCAGCGAQLPYDAQHCGHCLRTNPSWDHMVIVGKYAAPLSTLVHRFKFQNQFWLDSTLARLMLLAVRDARRSHNLPLPQVILSVPLHHFRQWRRGYNQADLLAKAVAEKLQIPCRNDLLYRIKHTPTQRGLNITQRAANLKNAFALSEKLLNSGYQRIALVDDVITTGATLNEISKQLHLIGVQHIQVWGICRV